MDIGAAGRAILFVSASVAQLLVASLCFAYAAHAFLVVFEETAAGNEEVTWSSDPVYDWLWKLFYLAALLLVSLSAAGVLLLFLLPLLLKWLLPIGFGLLLLALLNLVFPFFLLSSLSSDSLFQVLRVHIIGGLLRHLTALVIVFVVTAVLAAGWGALFYLTYFEGRMRWLPVMAAVGPAVLLMNARLLGRLAWIVSDHGSGKRKKKKKGKSIKGTAVENPWAFPEPFEQTQEEVAADKKEDKETRRQSDKEKGKDKETASGEDEEVGSYGLKEEELPPRSEPIPLDGEIPVGLDNEPPGRKENSKPPEPVAAESFKRRISRRRKEIPPPAHPLLFGVYTVPWQAGLWKVWLQLTLGFLLMGVLLWAQISFWPM
jgi:hypothetical protein